MNPQDGLYTLTERFGAAPQSRLIGAVREVLVAPRARDAVVRHLAQPGTHIASLTISEKGYCRTADGRLDPALAGEGSVFALLAAGFRLRRAAGLPGLTLLSCDNLAGNGHQLARLMGEYLERHDAAMVEWFGRECACPTTMVDRIVPATTAEDRVDVATRIGIVDEAAVVTEPFSQWVIENRFAGPRPRWESVGAALVCDVAPYETAKLRMLNGAHSALAYIGLARGHTFVHEAIRDPAINSLIERLMRDEAAPTIAAAPGQDLVQYSAALLERFANPALNHRLMQIAMDGSQKIPHRWLETLAANQAAGRDCPAILQGLAHWIRHLRGMNGPVDDPRKVALAAAVAGGDPLDALVGVNGLLRSSWVPREKDRIAVLAGLG
jgi:fructuronate reductase